MSKNSRDTSTSQTSNGEVKNSSYASEWFYSSWGIVTHDPLCFKD